MIILIKTGPGLPSQLGLVCSKSAFQAKIMVFQMQLNLQSKEDIKVHKLDPDDLFSFSNIELLLACLSTIEM